MSYEKLFRKGLVVLAFYGFGNLAFQAGKGHILSFLSEYDMSAKDLIKCLSEYDEKSFAVKIILGSYKIRKEHFQYAKKKVNKD